VEVLAHVLKEVCTFVEAGDIPDSEPKVASLTSARQTCSTTLGEVEDFLKKHSKMRGKSKRLIDTIKFISGDVKELQEKLRISTELLQLSLTSLTRYANTCTIPKQESERAVFQSFPANGTMVLVFPSSRSGQASKKSCRNIEPGPMSQQYYPASFKAMITTVKPIMMS
jgi:hypothetical protein